VATPSSAGSAAIAGSPSLPRVVRVGETASSCYGGTGYRVVRLTPPGSGCSIIFGEGVTSAPPGSCEGLQLSVYDIDEARADLIRRGVDVSEPFHDVTGVFHHAGTEGRLSGPAPEHADYGSFAAFSDPDGNGWLLQEIKTRLPGR
jgi:hypothetical protein